MQITYHKYEDIRVGVSLILFICLAHDCRQSRMSSSVLPEIYVSSKGFSSEDVDSFLLLHSGYTVVPISLHR